MRGGCLFGCLVFSLMVVSAAVAGLGFIGFGLWFAIACSINSVVMLDSLL